MEKLKMAALYGADAVYLAGKEFGLRAFAGNFSEQEMAEGIKFAALYGVKVYVTVNIFPHNSDLAGLQDYLDRLGALGVDGVIAADPGVVDTVLRCAPKLPVHLSTQANTTNYASAGFWFNQGVKRIVLARELSHEEIREIREKTSGELEIFVHGAMCMSYSGRCLLSNYLAGRDANRGECAQPCRWGYALVEEKRPGQYFPVEEDERGTYVFNSFDLSLLEHIPEVLGLGIDSLKLEGRMKSVNYVATVVKAYRSALDAYYADPGAYQFKQSWAQEIAKVSHRDYSTGFFFGRPGAEAHNLASSGYRRDYDFVGVVQEYDAARGMALVEQRNKFSAGETLEISGPKTDPVSVRADKIYDENFARVEAAPHAQQKLWIPVGAPVERYGLVRRERKNDR